MTAPTNERMIVFSKSSTNTLLKKESKTPPNVPAKTFPLVDVSRSFITFSF